MKFTKGDKVRCVKPDDGNLKLDAIYTIYNVDSSISEEYLVTVKELSFKQFWNWRFELAQKELRLSKELSAKVIRLITVIKEETNCQRDFDDAGAVLEELDKNDAS